MNIPDRIPLGTSSGFDWRGIEHRAIQILPFAREATDGQFCGIEAWCFGDFAVHRCLDLPGLWRITMLPLGLALAPDWCAFDRFEDAVAAMKSMQTCRNEGWGSITQADMTKPLERALKAIAAKHGAPTMRHAITPTGKAWIGGISGEAGRNKFGKVLSERPNGYGQALS